MNMRNRSEWSRLDRVRKQELMQELQGSLPEGFVFQGMETFEAAGQATESGVFLYKGSEFVFVPGDRPTLGWKEWAEAGETEARADGSFVPSPAAADFKEEEERLSRILSPVRSPEIGPMLAERRARYVGWTVVQPELLDPKRNARMLKQLEVFRAGEEPNRYYGRSYRFERKNGEIEVCLIEEPEDFEEWAGSALEAGFDLPTEDEWEYLYAGGRRTLFPWGEGPSFAEKPSEPDAGWRSAFGLLFIADAVEKELVRTDAEWSGKGGEEWTGKAGHGNREWLESADDVWPLLSLSAFYRDPYEDEQEWVEWLDQLHVRRIFRL